jgi:vacuolar-type H+-ATPase subunit D/Vma8
MEVMSAADKAALMREQWAREAAAAAERAAIARKQRPAKLKRQWREALDYINKAIEAAPRNVCAVNLWEFDRDLEEPLVKYLAKRGYRTMRRYISTPDSDWGADGELHPNGRTRQGVSIEIMWTI